MMPYVQQLNRGVVRMGVDIGGTHVSAELIKTEDGCRVEETYVRVKVNPAGTANDILNTWAKIINQVLERAGGHLVEAIGLAIPGPFDYLGGTSMIRGLAKYESLYGLNVREALLDRIALPGIPIFFGNDAACFGLGEAAAGKTAAFSRMIAITLGTGMGASYLENGRLVTSGDGVPPNGYLYNFPCLDGTAEEFFSARWLLGRYREEAGTTLQDVLTLASLADNAGNAPDHFGASVARRIFDVFGRQFGEFIGPPLAAFGADSLVIGGSISHSKHLFRDGLQLGLAKTGRSINIVFSENTERSAIAGAAALSDQNSLSDASCFARQTNQKQLASRSSDINEDPEKYRLFPFEHLGAGVIHSGYELLANWVITQKAICIDGCLGVNWPKIRHELTKIFRSKGLKTHWFETNAFMKSETEILDITSPFVGHPGSVWGKVTNLALDDFFTDELRAWRPAEQADVIVLAGTGAALSRWSTPVLYFDLAKNELQYRFRAGSVANLGLTTAGQFLEMYKRAYFVDWPVLRKHRQNISSAIAAIADGQRDNEINWALSPAIFDGMMLLSTSCFRVRPWFEPGLWGGQWLKNNIPQLSQQEVNYAWSFELIAPENGIVFESDGLLLEIAFDWLMDVASDNILGRDAERFGHDFPIRFDFLDCMDGDNLSIQCHPSLEYIRNVFGETITQDETYYILDQKGDSSVFLGFQEDINPEAFRTELYRSQEEKTEIDVEAYVLKMPSARHDLFLIPNRTIHGAGTNNLVLEISATPYIFTFKMYDWMRLDLEGRPRPINIDHAFSNLDFSRKGTQAKKELISSPEVLSSANGVLIENLPTHTEHFYAIHRITISAWNQSMSIMTKDKCHLLMVVEGNGISLRMDSGQTMDMRFAETYIISASSTSYKLINSSGVPIKVIKAFIK